MTIVLEPLTLDDLGSVIDLEARTYPTPWSEQVFRDEVGAPDRTYLKAVDDTGRLLGYGGLMVMAPEAHVTTVVVDHRWRGAGIGKRLMLELVSEARRRGATSLTLEVRASNAAAQALYRRFGLAPVGVRKKYYVDEDALIMWVHDIDSDDYDRRLGEIRTEIS